MSNYSDEEDGSSAIDESSGDGGSMLDFIFESLKHSIMRGEFAPGAQLKLRVLASTFNTSHMPVREALNRLLVTRAVETAPRRSVRIPMLSNNKARKILRVRLLLECYAIKLAAIVVTDEQIAKMKKLCEEMEAVCERRPFDIRQYLILNYDFHFYIYGIAGNEVLLNAIETCWLQYGPLLNFLKGDITPATHRYLHDLINALIKGNTEDAEKALENDLYVTADRIFLAKEQQLE